MRRRSISGAVGYTRIRMLGNLDRVRLARMVALAAPAIVGNEGFFDVGIEIPVFNRNQGAVTAAAADAERARLEVERRRNVLRRQFAIVCGEYSSATAAGARYKGEMLPRARRALEIYRANFRQMSAPYTQILASERSLIQMEEDYVAQLIVAWQAVAEIEGLLADVN